MTTPLPHDEETLVDLPPDEEEEVIMMDNNNLPPAVTDSARMVDETYVANEKQLARQKERQYLGWTFRDLFFYALLVVVLIFLFAALLVALGFVHMAHTRGDSYFDASFSSSSSSSSSTGS